MSVNKLNANTYEAYFNGCGYSFEITRDCGRWHVKALGRHIVGTLSQVINALVELANV